MGMMRQLLMGGGSKIEIGTLFSTRSEHPNGTPLPTPITMVEGLTYHFLYTGDASIPSTATRWPFYLQDANETSLFGCRFRSRRLSFFAYGDELTSDTYNSGLTLTSAELIVTMHELDIVYTTKINDVYGAQNVEDTRFTALGAPTFTTFGNIAGSFKIICTKEE